MKFVRKGDVFGVWRLDRLGCSLKHLIEIISILQQRGVGFKSLTENIDTTTSGGKLIFHVFGALAEFERDLIRERTQAGLAAARARGRQGGRPPILDEKKRKLLQTLYADKSNSVADILRAIHISKSTLYCYGRLSDLPGGKIALTCPPKTGPVGKIDHGPKVEYHPTREAAQAQEEFHSGRDH